MPDEDRNNRGPRRARLWCDGVVSATAGTHPRRAGTHSASTSDATQDASRNPCVSRIRIRHHSGPIPSGFYLPVLARRCKRGLGSRQPQSIYPSRRIP